MRKFIMTVVAVFLTACSSSENKGENTSDNTFIIKPMSTEHGQGDNRFIMSFVNQFNIERKVTVFFDGVQHNTKFDLCENDAYAKQIGNAVSEYSCPFELIVNHVTDNQYRVSVKATFLNGFLVKIIDRSPLYLPYTSDRDYSAILPMDNNEIKISFSDRPIKQ